MNRKMKKMEELRDSRILYDKKGPYFGFILISIISLLLIIITIWSIKTPKSEVIKSVGIIQSANKNYIMPSYTGEIVSIDISEGVNVQKGDILLVIKSTDLDLQIEQLQGQKKVYEEKVKQLKRLVEAIKTNKNVFSQSKESESQYYNQYESYQSQIAQNQLVHCSQ